jgi:PAS domain S-box-containing protein
MIAPDLKVKFRKYGLGQLLVWTWIVASILTFIINEYSDDTIKEAVKEARDYHGLNLQYRRWAASIGGLYAAADKVTPNPHLLIPDRDVVTDSGRSLTLVNPAYMSRMVFEAIRKDSMNPIINRLVSLKPLNPVNAPNVWELETLKLFENGKIRERFQVVSIGQRPYLQFMAAFITEESCLKCHEPQGYRVGDVRGGMSIAIPISGYLAIEADRRHSLVGGFALVWLLGGVAITASSIRRHQQEMKIVEEKIRLEEEIEERRQIQDQLEEQTLRLEEEITERRKSQDQLEEQAARLDEEVVERQQAVVALQKSDLFLQTIIESEPECVKLLDADCNLLMMNRSGLEMIEADSFEQVQGRCITPLVSEAYRSAFVELTNKVFQGIPGSVEFEVIGLKGRSLWLNTLAVPFRDENGAIVAALGITRNVTDLKRSVEALRNSEAMFRTLSFYAPVGIFQTDQYGNCVYVNNTWCKLTGLTENEARGTGWSKALHPDDRVKIVDEWNDAVRSNRLFSSEYRFMTPSGTVSWVAGIASSLTDVSSEISGYLGCVSDITERKLAEEDLRKKNAEIEQFIYTTSHDLRTPLVTVKTFLGFLENDLAGADQERVTQDLQYIHGAADKMKLLLDELLEMSRIDHVATPPVNVSFMHVVVDALDTMAGIIKEQRVEIHLPDTDLMLFGDRPHLSRIWLNLIENAIKYSRGDSPPHIDLGMRQVGGETVFFVKDNGIGIDPEYCARIFKMFEKLDTKSPGAGLGLSMVQRIVDKCGGRIWVESEGIGKGSCFYFTLPNAVIIG